MGVGGKGHATLRPFYPWGIRSTHCIGGWVGFTVGLEGCGESRPLPGIDPRAVQPVANPYTD